MAKCNVTKIKICELIRFVEIILEIKTKYVSLLKIRMMVQIVGDLLPQLCSNDSMRCNRRFSPAREFSQTLPRIFTGYEGTNNMFYFFYEIIIFRLNKEKDYIRSAYVYLNFFHKTVTSCNLETEPNIFLVLHSAINTLVDQSKRLELLSKLFYKMK